MLGTPVMIDHAVMLVVGGREELALPSETVPSEAIPSRPNLSSV